MLGGGESGRQYGRNEAELPRAGIGNGLPPGPSEGSERAEGLSPLLRIALGRIAVRSSGLWAFAVGDGRGKGRREEGRAKGRAVCVSGPRPARRI